ncbi:DUF4276 family protein [Paraburkholderia lacunae]|uniref:DUF4276 domain-containing protein n=1 Tax=Paraburkholderia lacunae TaxID=2211104 RepID=A0A370N6D9_9BURK|nr:DUF3097 family protein [Paraburkholderia lacunae]RDK01186.1 hypothetical protein DLM46_17820 [Paraburkholderia lacunae]
MQEKLKIIVEGRADVAIIENLILALEYQSEGIVVEAWGGKDEIKKRVKKLELRQPQKDKLMILIDSDLPSVEDSREHARYELGNPDVSVFCAVPTIEAWLFADKELALTRAKGPNAKSVIERITSPESIPHPKNLARLILRTRDDSPESYNFFSHVDVLAAASRSPSLATFVEGVNEKLGRHSDILSEAIASHVPQSIFANLLKELPGGMLAWRTLDKDYTAEELFQLVDDGDPIGLQYLTDLLRLSRDILAARKAGVQSDEGTQRDD